MPIVEVPRVRNRGKGPVQCTSVPLEAQEEKRKKNLGEVLMVKPCGVNKTRKNNTHSTELRGAKRRVELTAFAGGAKPTKQTRQWKKSEQKRRKKKRDWKVLHPAQEARRKGKNLRQATVQAMMINCTRGRGTVHKGGRQGVLLAVSEKRKGSRSVTLEGKGRERNIAASKEKLRQQTWQRTQQIKKKKDGEKDKGGKKPHNKKETKTKD